MKTITKKEMRARVMASIENLISITSKCENNSDDEKCFYERGEEAIYIANYLGLISDDEEDNFKNRLFGAYCHH